MTDAPDTTTATAPGSAEGTVDPATESDEAAGAAASEAVRDEAAGVDVAELVEGGPILLFDGVCNLCNWTIQFVIARDDEKRFRFAPLQSPTAAALLENAGVEQDRMESFVMVDGDEVYVKSAAALHVARELGLPWSLAYPLVYLPRILRDTVYEFVAEHRYRVFGRKDRCMVPDEDVSDRFLE